jgi:uncharacterized protein YndB with AHSA1/START domain
MTLTDTTFRTSITVEAPIERAFTVFTERFDAWWPRSHHIGTADMAEAMLEPRVGGRWHERGVDGSECEWGRVLAWDPSPCRGTSTVRSVTTLIPTRPAGSTSASLRRVRV